MPGTADHALVLSVSQIAVERIAVMFIWETTDPLWQALLKRKHLLPSLACQSLALTFTARQSLTLRATKHKSKFDFNEEPKK
jgi:hypothetical protein